jgi:ectoine hydroxylase-related dioxygenase (phytanoyl-CoA dioxygenase family)
VSDLGFSIFENILSPEECNSLAKAIGGALSGRAGTRNLLSNPAVSSLAHDSRLLQLAAEALGTCAVPFRATLFDKSTDSNWHVCWHQDRALPLVKRIESLEWGPWSTKSGVLYALAPAWAMDGVVALRIHIDASTNSNGPLRVIPRSHKLGVISAPAITRTINSVPATTCIVGRGGVVAMRPLLLHSSTKAIDNEPRRVVHIEYASSLNIAPNVHLRVA